MTLFELEVLLGSGELALEIETEEPPYRIHGTFTAGDGSVWQASGTEIETVMLRSVWEEVT